MSFKLTWGIYIKCFLICLAITAIFYNPITAALNSFIIEDIMLYPTRYIMLNFFIYIILLMIPISIVHELIHGYMFKLYGGKVKYGFKVVYAYTHEISGKAFERTKFFVILLAPLVVISILSLLIGSSLFNMVIILNALGASGDIYMVLLLCRFKPNCKIIDRKYGFDVVYD